MVPPTSHIKLDRWGVEFGRAFTPEVWRGQSVNVERLLDVVLTAPPFNIDVGIMPLPEGIEGITEPPGRLLIPPEVYDGLQTDPRAKFTGTHEAVHAVLHLKHLDTAYYSSGSLRLFRREEMYRPSDPEWQANRGAAAILMPAPLVWELIERHGFIPEPLMQRFGVSYTSANYRVKNAQAHKMWASTPVARRLALGLSPQ